MPHRPPALALALLCLAACTPEGFPENPFVVTEQGLVAPELQPLDSGFPSRAELDLLDEAEEDAFRLDEEGADLGARGEALAARREEAEASAPREARDRTGPEPDTDTSEATERAGDLRSRADALRERTE